MYFRLFLLLWTTWNALLFSNNIEEPSVIIAYYSQKEIEANVLGNSYSRAITQMDIGHPKNLISCKDFPVGKTITVSIKRPLEPNASYKKNFEFKLDKDGIFEIENSKTSHITISSKGFLPGEKITLMFHTTDKEFKYVKSFIPNPINAKSASEKFSVTAELIMFTPSAETYQIRLKGIEENELIFLESISGRERIKNHLIYKENNPILISPGEEFKLGGISKLSITSNRETVTVDLPWGAELAKYTKGEAIYSPCS